MDNTSTHSLSSASVEECKAFMRNAVKLWVYWCSNYTEPEKWIRAIWPGEYQHFLSKWQGLRNNYSGDETMNRFFRELSSNNQKKLINYVLDNYKL